MSRIPSSESRRRPAEVPQADRGSKARKVAPSNFAPVASLSGGTVPVNAHVPPQPESFPSMHTRALGKLLVDANKQLTAGQRRTVIAMGFGPMLNFQIADTPLRLGNWLLSNLDIDSMQLKFPNGLTLKVDEEAVEAVFGLPRGPKVITDRAKHQKSIILNIWRESYEKTDYTITPVEVAIKLEKYLDGGECFIRNYALLVVSTIVRTMQNGYVYQHVIPNLEDTLEIANLNWCQYVIHSLVATQPAWKARKTQRFTGPLVFLTVLYVDRVQAGACTVPRTLPAFVGWDSELLKQREELEVTSGGFGRGTIVEPLQPKKKDLRVRVTEQARLVAPGILQLVELLREAEMEADQSDQSSKLFNTARSLVGIHPTVGVPAHAPPPAVSADGTETDDDFYSNPDVLKAVEEIEHAVHKRNALYNGPSLSGVLPEDAATTTVRQMTNNATSEQRASGMSTRSGAKHNGVTPCAQPSSSAPPISPPQSIRVNGVTAAPQGMSTRSTAKHNRVSQSALPSSSATPISPPQSICVNGVTTAPQVVAQVPGAPLSITRHQTAKAPHVATKPPQVPNHPPTPVVRNQSYHMAPVDELDPAVLQQDEFSDVPSFSLGLTQDVPTSPVRHTTTFATPQQRLTVITSPNATPGRLHHSMRDDGVAATPQDVASILGTHTSTSGTPVGRAPLKAPKPPHYSKHQPTPVRTKLSHHVSQMGGRPSWTVPSQTYVYHWIVDNLAVNRDDEIFRYKAYKASWGNVASLQEGSKVAYRVVDAWACVLNYRELTKGAAVPNRLFASTKTALQSAVNYTALRYLRLGWFTKSLEEDFSKSPRETWRGIHIYIFPILQRGHFYMISVDTIAKKVDIIDNSSAAEPKDRLYGQTPNQLVDMFSTFLDDKLETEIASQIRGLIPKRMQMSWRVPKNQVDSAVFTMRHMESY
ncbi:uncharacterized protein LOC116011343 [Ipomoea triloba]|uniref:uncharacterized protein LOC116011343 n=1 Tax=Ipomoea triloba TaxID=35885 RepID=UPI00125CEBC4|nr:uncharacterized protein LOC116011343 [Ipomoea triloba]